ncbi:MAG: hypothetical protein QNK15_00825, partial [Cycloclasticus sp.]|nr:hypothetical protein [Cycloclasticus sp.]
PCGSGSTTERRAQFCFASDRVRTLPGDSGGPIYWLRPGRTRVLVGVARQTDDNGGNYVATFFNRTMNGPDSFNVGLWIEQVANPTILP